MKSQLKILIVLYNKKIEDSETIVSLAKIVKDIPNLEQIIVWDNSKVLMTCNQQVALKETLSPINVDCKGNGINTSLSIIYNETIKTLKENDILIILDHDSNIPIEYFTSLIESINMYVDVNLFLPIIKYNNSIVSPANSWYFKGSYWEKEKYGLVEAKHQNAINSGMAIRASYLKNDFVGYDQNLQFYGTDSDFMYKYRTQNKYFCVLHAVVYHTLDFYDNKDVESKLSRFRQMKRAALINMKKINLGVYLLCYLYFVLFSIKLAFSTKDFRFLH